jgi:hypothetical protein
VSDWDSYLATLADTVSLLPLLSDPADPAQVAQAERLFFLTLASGWYTAFADPDRPDFVPAVNTHLNAVGTNPDFIYGTASIDGTGHYLLTGERGDGLFVLMDIAAGGLGVMDKPGPSLGTVDFDRLTRNDGRFALLLSTERPDDWTGDWHQLDPAARSLSLRQASYDWGVGREARIAIERTDAPAVKARPDAAEIGRRLSALAGYPKRLAGMALGFIAAQRAKDLWNRFEHDDWAGQGGLSGQHYYQGLFRLEPGMVLVLETELPETFRYWNVQLSDMVWNSIDWMNHQSSLNGGQARIDGDGTFRAVIAIDDPGVPNWLDPAGNHEGAIMLRWTGASSGPVPTLRMVRQDELHVYLPAETPLITPEARRERLTHRRRAVQLRRRW